MSATTQAVVRKGVRYRKAKTRDGRWGEGRVHVLIWDRLNQMWWPSCDESFTKSTYHLLDMPWETPATCKRCKELNL